MRTARVFVHLNCSQLLTLSFPTARPIDSSTPSRCSQEHRASFPTSPFHPHPHQLSVYGYRISEEGQATVFLIPHIPAPIMEAKFLVSVVKKSAALFIHSAPLIYIAEAQFQIWQSENTGVPITLSPALS